MPEHDDLSKHADLAPSRPTISVRAQRACRRPDGPAAGRGGGADPPESTDGCRHGSEQASERWRAAAGPPREDAWFAAIP